MKKAGRGPAVSRRDGKDWDFLQGEGIARGPLKPRFVELYSS